MKKLFLMFIFLSAIVSCGGETKETNKCDGVSCNEWEQCNATSGVCEAKSGRCNANRDCSGTNICDANHNCINPDNPCENQTCSSHGTCIVENNSAKCNCETGYVADGLTCIEKTCEAGETKSISCGDNGETQNQVCENGVWKNQGTCLCVNSSTKTTTCQGDGLQYQTCVNGSWTNIGECIGTVCSTAGETREVACGFNGNGTQNQVCVNLKWTNTGTCADPDICGNGTTQLVENSTCASQSLNGRGKAEQICANGQWIDYEGNCKDPDICEDDAQETIDEVCGFNNRGTKYKKCVIGQWEFNCNDIDVCRNGTTQLVDNYNCMEQSLNGRGQKEQICTNGQWIDSGNCKDSDICKDESVEYPQELCEGNKKKFNLCVTGQWVEHCDKPLMSVTPNSVTFFESSVKTIVIENIGTKNLTLQHTNSSLKPIFLSVGTSMGFSLTNELLPNNGTLICPKEAQDEICNGVPKQITVSINYNSQNQNDPEGNVVVMSDDLLSDIKFIPLIGKTHYCSLEIIPISDDTLDFGEVSIQNTNGFPKQVSVTNKGSEPCTVGNVYLSTGTDSAVFWMTGINNQPIQTFPTTLQRFQSFSFLVMFKPTAVQAYSGELIIEADAPIWDNGKKTINLIGSGSL